MKTRALFLAICVVLAAGIVPRSALAEFHIVGDVVCDNSFAVFTGDALGGALALHGGGAYPAIVPFDFSTPDPAVYLVAWSDDAIHQGLLHDLSINGTPHWSNGPGWMVCATGRDLDVSFPEGCPSAAEVSVQIAAANQDGRWQPVTVGGPNEGRFPPTNAWQQAAPIPRTAHWAWFDSGRQSGADTPFRPGFDHGEYLIFRLLLDLPLPAEPQTLSSIKALFR
jgi:hypothetical protein